MKFKQKHTISTYLHRYELCYEVCACGADDAANLATKVYLLKHRHLTTCSMMKGMQLRPLRQLDAALARHWLN